MQSTSRVVDSSEAFLFFFLSFFFFYLKTADAAGHEQMSVSVERQNHKIIKIQVVIIIIISGFVQPVHFYITHCPLKYCFSTTFWLDSLPFKATTGTFFFWTKDGDGETKWTLWLCHQTTEQQLLSPGCETSQLILSAPPSKIGLILWLMGLWLVGHRNRNSL